MTREGNGNVRNVLKPASRNEKKKYSAHYLPHCVRETRKENSTRKMRLFNISMLYLLIL